MCHFPIEDVRDFRLTTVSRHLCRVTFYLFYVSYSRVFGYVVMANVLGNAITSETYRRLLTPNLLHSITLKFQLVLVLGGNVDRDLF